MKTASLFRIAFLLRLTYGLPVSVPDGASESIVLSSSVVTNANGFAKTITVTSTSVVNFDVTVDTTVTDDDEAAPTSAVPVSDSNRKDVYDGNTDTLANPTFVPSVPLMGPSSVPGVPSLGPSSVFSSSALAPTVKPTEPATSLSVLASSSVHPHKSGADSSAPYASSSAPYEPSSSINSKASTTTKPSKGSGSFKDLAFSVTSGLQPAEATAKAASVQMKDFDIKVINGDLKDFEKPTKKFVDGTIPCDTFPIGQGVIPVPWIGYGGWSSIQQKEEGGAPFSGCVKGALCLYACQAGMLKTQWPMQQPGDLESRGGLECRSDGKLYRTNKRLEYLCEWGHKSVNAVSKLDKVVSLCRTDYPGSENMNIPTRLMPGESKPMSVVIEDGYYEWNGKPSSAQYYVNNAGVDVQDGCLWSNLSTTVGNWAPIVLGAGYINNFTWLSIIPNPENNHKNNGKGVTPNYNIEIKAVGKSKIGANCYIKNGIYSGSQGAASDGCTVSVDGSANFVFSPRSD